MGDWLRTTVNARSMQKGATYGLIDKRRSWRRTEGPPAIRGGPSWGTLRWSRPRHCVGTAISTSVALSVVILEILRRYSVEMVQIDVWHQAAPSEWVLLSAEDQGFANATRVVGLKGRYPRDPRGPKSTPGHDNSQDHDTIALDPTDVEI